MSWILVCIIIASIWQMTSAAITAAGDLILEPISDEYWGVNEQTTSSKRVAGNPYIKLLEKEHFVWAAPEDSGQILYANMTMHTKNDELVISMERFASDLKYVNCSSNMVMTFTSDATFQAAIAEWSWVNLNDNRTFIIITNYEGCGPTRSRKPWLVNTVSYDEAHFTVYLNATERTWKEVAHTYELDWGRFLPGNTSSTSRRSLLSWDPSFTVDLSYNFPTDFYAAKKIGQVTFNIDCNNCATRGSFQFAGHIASDLLNGLSAFSVSAAPHGVSLDLPLKIKASGSLNIGKLSNAWNFAALGIPGFTIDEILKVGPNLNFAAGYNLSSFKGAVTVGTGFSASIPDQSLAEVDLFGKDVLDIYGWQPTFSPKPLDINVAVSFGLELYVQTSVDVSLDCLGNGFDIGLGLKLPDFTISGDVKFDPIHGACKGSQQPVGAEIGLNAGAALDLLGYTEIAGTRNYFINKALFEVGANFFDFGPYCFPFGSLPGDPGEPKSSSILKTIVSTASAGPNPTSSGGYTPPPPSGLGSTSCKTTGDGLRYRICPNTSLSCPAMGQYPIGTLVYFKCYVQGEQENGDWDTSSWGKTANGYYVSLAYVNKACAAELPPC